MTDEQEEKLWARQALAEAERERRKPSRPQQFELEGHPEEFYGLTDRECCRKCLPHKCVITGVGICAHPYKGGLQGALTLKADVVDRFTNAKKYLAHQKVDR